MQEDTLSQKQQTASGRRSFLNKIWLLLSGIICIEIGWLGISTIRSRQKKDLHSDELRVVTAGTIKDFTPGTVTPIPQGQFYMACLENGGLLALSKKCTHLGCAVPWNEEQQRFVCPCHGSTFSITGEVLSAPAPRPLDIYPVRIEDGQIKVTVSQPERRDTFNSSQVTRLA